MEKFIEYLNSVDSVRIWVYVNGLEVASYNIKNFDVYATSVEKSIVIVDDNDSFINIFPGSDFNYDSDFERWSVTYGNFELVIVNGES